MERRTILVVLSRPVSRFQFLIGKYLGLASLICVNWAVFSAIFLLVLLTSGGALTLVLLFALVLILCQTLAIGAIAFFFSTFTTAALSVIFTLGFYLIGNNISQIRFLSLKTASPP